MADNKNSSSGLGLLKRLFQFTLPYKNKFWLSIILSVVLALLSPVRPYLIQLSVDKYIANHLLQGLITITIIQIGILLIESILRLVFMYVSSWVGQTIVDDMRKAVFKKISFQNLRFFDHTPVGTLTTRTVNDIEAVNDVFSEGIISILADVLTIIAIIGIMLYTDWRLTLISLAVFPLLILATYFFKESVKKSFQTVRNAVAQLNAFVQEHIMGMYVVQAFGIEAQENDKFKAINKVHRDANIKSIFAYSVFFPIVEIILALSMGLLVWYGAVQMLDETITQGVIIAFIMYLNQLFRPLRMLADKFNTLQMGLVAGGRVMQVLDSDDYLHNNGSLKVAKLNGHIKLENVHFEYKEATPVLRGVNFEVNSGDTIAIVGPTGAGKTSIISILTRLYEIKEGTILIDGVDIKSYDVSNLRQHVGIVLQDVFLFADTVLNNITMNNEQKTAEEVVAICKYLEIHAFIMSLPGGYNFKVGERGGALSQGQKQLISFARALLYNPSILILDEATSSIDTASEILVQQAIDKLIKNRTSIVIAHRLSTIRKANQIIVLEKGRVIEQGSHKKLMELTNGVYAQMYQAAKQKQTENI